MTKSDFEIVAKLLRKVRDGQPWMGVVIMFADELERTHPRFKRGRFLDACGFPEGAIRDWDEKRVERDDSAEKELAQGHTGPRRRTFCPYCSARLDETGLCVHCDML